MSKTMKVSLVLLVCGVFLCGLAILYMYKIEGSQPVFITAYIAGSLTAGVGGGSAAYLSISRKWPKLKIPGGLFAVIVFAVVVVGLFSPFYMLKAE